MKKVLSLFLSILMLCSITAGIDLSALAATSGNYTYSLDSGTVTITAYSGSATSLTIPSKLGGYKVTSIGGSAFYKCTSLESVKIPSSVISVGSSAFAYCTNLESITIPSSVMEIGESAFAYCTSLDNVEIPSSITSLNGAVFQHCSSLSSITIPDSVTSLGSSVFNCCTNLISAIIGSGVTGISYCAFSQCTNLENLIIPNNVTSIGEGAFSSCTSLTSLAIPDSVTYIDDYAFENCTRLKSVFIPSSVKEIGYDAFEGCTSITDVYYAGSWTAWDEIYFHSGNEYLTDATMHYNHSHSNSSGKYTYAVKATTSGKGIMTYTCSVCGGAVAKNYAKIKSVTLSKTAYTYDGKAKKPTVTVKDASGNTISSQYYTVTYVNRSSGDTVSSMKSVGKYYVKVKFKGKYSGTVKKELTIKSKTTSIKSITAKSKGFTVKWGKVTSSTTGYQVQYSTSKSFSSKTTKTITSNSTTSKKITGLKAKKKYYVRVRTYKTVKINGKSTKIYSSWSKAKTVTTKK